VIGVPAEVVVVVVVVVAEGVVVVVAGVVVVDDEVVVAGVVVVTAVVVVVVVADITLIEIFRTTGGLSGVWSLFTNSTEIECVPGATLTNV
jgi:hypothetical protein